MRDKKILVRGVNWLGDAVMSTAALLRLREACPSSEICLLTPKKLAGLWRKHPAVNRTIEFSSEENVWTVAKKLRNERFDLGLVFPNSFRSAFEIWLAGIPERIGYAGNGRAGFLTKAIPARLEAVRMHKRSDREIRRLIAGPGSRETQLPAAHHIHQYLRLTAEAGANIQPVAPFIRIEECEKVEFVAKFGLTAGGPVIALGPGAEYGPAKRWPVESFITAASEVQKKQFRGTWILVGGANDFPVCERIALEMQKGMPSNKVLNLAGKTTLRELGAALAISSVLLTNDTGPMHLAAAVGTRVVGIFGSTSPELTGPGLEEEKRHLLLYSEVGCAPCFRRVCPIDFRCMREIRPEKAAGAVMQLLAREK